MKYILSILIVSLFAVADTLPKYECETAELAHERMEWWNEARYGMFIHWGLYAIPARGEWVMIDEKQSVADYSALASEFNPEKFNAQEWIKMTQRLVHIIL